MSKAEPLFYVKGSIIFKRPVHRKTLTGTNITIGFEVCTASEYVSAKDLAAILNENERPEVDAPSPQAPDHTQVEAIIRDWLGDYVSLLPPTDGVSKKIVSALGVAQAVPEGFALVPLKPTLAMIEAGCENNPTQWNDGTDDGFTSDVANNVYVAMVRAGSLVSSTVRKAPKSCPHCIDETDCASVDICNAVAGMCSASSTHSNTVADSSGSNPGAIGASKEAGGIAGFATVAPASNPSSTKQGGGK